MTEFFNGWRRKVGVLTLVMACVTMAAWIRSGNQYNSFYFYSGDNLNRPFTFAGRLGLFRIIGRPTSNYEEGVLVGPDDVEVHFSVGNTRSEIDEKREMLGFHFQTGNVRHKSRYSVYTIPYWSIVIPLTALAAFLLLSKPRQSTSMQTPEPTAHEGFES